MKLKKTCNGCRALITASGPCRLGYNTTFDFKKALVLGFKEAYPTEPCPKPLTYAALQTALERP